MSYSYQKTRPVLFTEEGQAMVLAAYAKAQHCIKIAGAVCITEMTADIRFGDTDTMLAIGDRLVELGYLRRVTGPDTWGQHQVYVLGSKGEKL